MVVDGSHSGSCVADIRDLVMEDRWEIPAFAGMTAGMRHCERSEAIFSSGGNDSMEIASSLSLLAMTGISRYGGV